MAFVSTSSSFLAAPRTAQNTLSACTFTTRWRLAETAPLPSSRRRAQLIMSSAEAETDGKTDEDEEEVPADNKIDISDVPEPYPGYFADMKRMGLTEEQAIVQALKQQKQRNPTESDRVGGAKNLFKPDGTAYAPWMAGISSEYKPSVIKKRTDATGRLAADPQQAELSGLGMTWKMLGDDLELSWITGAEEGNVGFVIYRREGQSDEWKKLDDYRSSGALVSKGATGGAYSYIVEQADPGTWVYRVSDVDEGQNVMDLSQVLVEIESAEDNKSRIIALAVLLAVLLLAGVVGFFVDPQAGA